MLFLARLLFSVFLLAFGWFCLKLAGSLPESKKDFKGYPVLLGIYSLLVGGLCLFGAITGF